MSKGIKIEIHSGELGWQSSPVEVKKLGNAFSIPVHIVSGAGHGLPKDYVSNVVDRFLN